ncbi:MAG: hypothetical protein IIY06_04480 [Proteobacteria bacterium]|jgi:predicted  nucleic acid-binding Zn-ribbon protein|nr:hypothetical protein [Pseudomonadota bacterium]
MAVLIELQKLDLEQDKLRINVDNKIKKVEEDREKLVDLEDSLRSEEQDLEETQSLLSKRENELVEAQNGYKHTEDKLNAATNSRDFATIEQERETFKRTQVSIEEEIRTLKEAISKKEVDIKDHRNAYAALNEENQKMAAEAETEAASIEDKVNALKEKVAELSKKVKPEILKRYNFIRKKRPGLAAVVSASNGTCEGCHMKLQPQVYIRLQRQNSLECCQNCQRILYFDVSEHLSHE